MSANQRPEAGALEQEVFAEQIRVLLGNTQAVLLVNAIAAAMYLLAMRDTVDPRLMLAWLALLGIALMARALLWLGCRRVDLTPENARTWARRFTLGALASGLLWGAAGILPAAGDDQGFVVFLLGGLAAGAVVTSAPIYSVYLAFVLPSLLPVGLSYLAVGSGDHALRGGMVLFFIVITGIVAWRHHQILRSTLILSLQLRRHRDHLQELVEERTANLEEARQAAEAADLAKTQFLANMSHELRTPMHAILSFAALGLERAADAPRETLRDYYSYVHDSGKRLLNLVNNLLDLAKFEAHRMPMDLRPHDMRDLVQRIVDEMQGLLGEKDLRCTLEPPTTDTRMQCDAERVLQLLRNLLSNAVKYSPPGGRIRIRMEHSGVPAGRRETDTGSRPALAVTVEDQGPGVPEQELASIFDKFVQSSKTRSGAGGTGLGLAICREIAQAHGGVVFARNLSPEGAAFTFRIPYRPPSHPAADQNL